MVNVRVFVQYGDKLSCGRADGVDVFEECLHHNVWTGEFGR